MVKRIDCERRFERLVCLDKATRRQVRLSLAEQLNRTRRKLIVRPLADRCGRDQRCCDTGNQNWGQKAHPHLLGPGGSNMG